MKRNAHAGAVSDGASMTNRVPVLETRAVSKRYGSVQALIDVDFEVYAGEVVGLLGDNGAGKSTLVKSIAGAHHIDSGTIRVAGVEAKIHSPADATALGITVIYQDLALCDNLDVVANVFLGREELRGFGGPLRNLAEIEMERRAVGTLRDLEVNIPNPRARVASLSGGQRQSVAIAKAVMWNSQVVILDEPTAALGVVQTKQVLDLIKRLRAQGLGVVLISHNIPDIFEVADRIVVLRLGRRVATLDASSASEHDVVSAITGAVKAEAS